VAKISVGSEVQNVSIGTKKSLSGKLYSPIY